MSKVLRAVKGFVREEEGATMVEYALMLALIAIVCIAAVTAVGSKANLVFGNSATALTNAS